MYVRWKVRKLSKRGSQGPARRAFYAVVAECSRVDGKPRQKVIKYLGRIHEQSIADPAERLEFWKSALGKLDELDIESAIRSKLESKMSEVVPRPSNLRRSRNGAARPAAPSKKSATTAARSAASGTNGRGGSRSTASTSATTRSASKSKSGTTRATSKKRTAGSAAPRKKSTAGTSAGSRRR